MPSQPIVPPPLAATDSHIMDLEIAGPFGKVGLLADADRQIRWELVGIQGQLPVQHFVKLSQCLTVHANGPLRSLLSLHRRANLLGQVTGLGR